MEEEIYLFAQDVAILYKNTNNGMVNTKQQRSKKELVQQISFGVKNFSFDEAERRIFSSKQENYEQYRFVSHMRKKVISFLFPETLFHENDSYIQASKQFFKSIHAQKSEVPKRKVVRIMFYSSLASPILLKSIFLVREGEKKKDESICEEAYQKRREFERK